MAYGGEALRFPAPPISRRGEEVSRAADGKVSVGGATCIAAYRGLSNGAQEVEIGMAEVVSQNSRPVPIGSALWRPRQDRFRRGGQGVSGTSDAVSGAR
jgi:hypothetical protein